MKYAFDRSVLHDLDRASRLEWLESNGRGGWASSTVTGLHVRRRNAVLAIADAGRERPAVLLSRLDETLIAGADRHELGVNRFPGAVHPKGHLLLRSFEKEWFPVFTYQAGPIVLEKTVAALHGENTTAVVYRVIDAPAELTLVLRPLVAQRDASALVQANGGIAPYGAFEGGVFRVRPYPGTPEWFVSVPGARFQPGPDWWRSFEYAAEGAPGSPAREDLFTYGTFAVTLRKGDRLGVLVSTDDPAGRDALALVDAERDRREAIVRGIPESQPVRRSLALAADAWVARSEAGPVVLGGYPEMSEHPRDAAIATPGIFLTAGRDEEARQLLLRLAAEGAGDLESALWLFVAVHAWAQSAGDASRAAETFLPSLRQTIARLDEGRYSGARVDDLGLLAETGSGARRPDVNALWFNALSILADLEKRGGDADAARALATRARAVKSRWAGAFPPESPVEAASVFALSLPYGLLSKDDARRLLDSIEERLLGPVGMRVQERGGRLAFVPALLGAYATACVKVMGAAGKPRARKALESVAPLLANGLLGHVPDACDVREPYDPLGASASARATGELLRAWKLVGVAAKPAPRKRSYRVVSTAAKPAVRAKPKSGG